MSYSAAARALLTRSRVVFLDVESTGLDDGAQVCAVAVVDTLGRVLFDEIIRPSVPNGAEHVNYLSAERLAQARPLMEWWGRLRTTIDGATVIAYNSDFDKRMLTQSGARVKHARFECAMRLCYAELFGSQGKWPRLSESATFVGVPPRVLHTALGDALLCRAIVFKLANL